MAILVLFALSAPFMSSASAFYHTTSSPYTSDVFLTPSRISSTTGTGTVTVYANVTNVVDMDTFQLGLDWSNTTVAQCTSVAIGNIFNSFSPSDVIGISGSINNTAGIISYYSWSLIGTLAYNGSGTLAVFTFTIENKGYADLHIDGLFLETVQSTFLPTNLVDYFTVVRGGQQYVCEVQGNPEQSASIPPYNAGFYEENVTQMSPTKEDGVSGLIGNMTFGINGTSVDISAFGYLNVTIPNNLMNCSGNNADWIVVLNNGTGPQIQSARTVSQGASTTTISLSNENFYPPGNGLYGTTIVNIYSTNIAVPEFASTYSAVLLATLLTLATLAAALFIKIAPRRKQKS